MKESEVQDAEAYVYIKVIAALSKKFKVGDYVKTYGLHYNDDRDKDVWGADKAYVGSFRSRIDHSGAKNFRVEYEMIKKITKVEGGYIEAESVPAFAFDKNFAEQWGLSDEAEPYCLTGHYNIRDEIENMMYENDDENMDLDEMVEFLCENYIRLDEDYAESIMLESEYVPYASQISIKEDLARIQKLTEQETKELLRQRALRGHATRKANKLKAKKEAAAAKRLAAKAAKAIAVSKPKKAKISKKRGKK